MDKQAVTVETPYGVVTAHWHREGRMISIRYGERVKRAKASDDDATNGFVARDVLRHWVAEDLKDNEDS